MLLFVSFSFAHSHIMFLSDTSIPIYLSFHNENKVNEKQFSMEKCSLTYSLMAHAIEDNAKIQPS